MKTYGTAAVQLRVLFEHYMEVTDPLQISARGAVHSVRWEAGWGLCGEKKNLSQLAA
jgi:hypothetical protein